ncbi:MAG: metal ABC transporter permease [Candidatus Methylacidiphilales bacterium]
MTFEDLLVPFQYEYTLKAMFVSALIGGVCAFLSCFITLKGWSLMGDALSHSVVPGVALAYIFGLPFAVGAFAAGLLAAGGMAFVRSNTRLREDAVIGVIFSTFFALGLVLTSLYPSNVNIKNIIFGNILGIADSDIIQIVIISSITLLIIGLKWRDFVLFCFDSNHARSIGINVTLLHVTLMTLLAATAVAALQTVGACLVVAMLITPGATAYLLTDQFSRMLWIACAMGVSTSFFGAYASDFLNGSSGGIIVVFQTGLFLLALVFAPRHGLLASRSKRIASLKALLPGGTDKPSAATTEGSHALPEPVTTREATR